jgi:lipopolysaccharide transport system permease protein
LSLPESAVAEQPEQAFRSAGSDQVWVIEPRGVGPVQRAKEVWRSRHLLRYFAIRTVQRSYRRTLLGWLWLVIRPVVPVIIYTFVFNQMAGIQSGATPYFLFFMVGNAAWGVLEESLMWITRSFQINKGLLGKMYFPRIILPVAATGPALVTLAIQLVLIVGASLYYLSVDGQLYLSLGWHSWLALAGVLLTLVLAIGIGFFTSVLGAEHRDIRFTLGYIFRFWFFLTPIVYPLSLVPEQWRGVAAVNPMTTSVELFKWGLLGIRSELGAESIATALVIVGLVFAAGLVFFVRAEAASIDRL